MKCNICFKELAPDLKIDPIFYFFFFSLFAMKGENAEKEKKKKRKKKKKKELSQLKKWKQMASGMDSFCREHKRKGTEAYLGQFCAKFIKGIWVL